MGPTTPLHVVSSNVPSSLSQLQVMIFSDNEPFRKFLKQALREIGIFRTVEASNAETLDGRFQGSAAIDVILSDLKLSCGSGLALLKAIRLGIIGGIRPDVCLIFVTDIVDRAVIAAAAQLDACGCLVEPIVPMRLRASILRGQRKPIHLDAQRYVRTDITQTFAGSARCTGHLGYRPQQRGDLNLRGQDPMNRRETLDLLRSYSRISDYDSRHRIRELAKLASSQLPGIPHFEDEWAPSKF